MKLRYRLYTGLIFSSAAVTTLPLWQLLLFVFSVKDELTYQQLLHASLSGSLFAIAAFFWGALLTSHFRGKENRGLVSHIVICFSWGCVIPVLTIISTSLVIGITQSSNIIDYFEKSFSLSLIILIYGTMLMFGLFYVVGGAAGIIAGLLSRSIPHNQWLKLTPNKDTGTAGVNLN